MVMRPPDELQSLYSAAEWERFEAGVRHWLGEDQEPSSLSAGLLSVDAALLAPSAFTYAVAARGWMLRLGLDDLAERIEPSAFTDTDVFALRGTEE